MILVAEVLLQQTQAPRVAERFPALIGAMATPAATAELGPTGVLQLWSGMGYNARAIRLHRCAVQIVTDYDGEVPLELDALLKLPGIGPYTARAICVFAAGQDLGVYDTNVARVIARALTGTPVSAGVGQTLADAMVPTGQGWLYNQAVLDLGATICTARAPQCHRCPVARRCRFKRAGGDDPARTTAGTARAQGTFEGSDRQGRGRIIARLRLGPATVAELGVVTGWGDGTRLHQVLDRLGAAGLLSDLGHTGVVLGQVAEER